MAPAANVGRARQSGISRMQRLPGHVPQPEGLSAEVSASSLKAFRMNEESLRGEAVMTSAQGHQLRSLCLNPGVTLSIDQGLPAHRGL